MTAPTTSTTQCPGGRKRRYPDRVTAESALITIAVRSKRDRVPVRAYHCHRCDGWHLTSWPTPTTPAVTDTPRRP